MKELVFLYIDHSLAGYRIYPEVPDGAILLPKVKMLIFGFISLGFINSMASKD